MRRTSWSILLGLTLGGPAMAEQMFVPYPVGAAQRGEHGSTAVGMVIDQAGEIVRCLVTRSSGSADLDRATCPLVTKDRRYVAAKPGDPLRVDAQVVHWRLPGIAPTAADLPILRSDNYILFDASRTPAAEGKYHQIFLTNVQAPLPRPFQPGLEPVNMIAEIEVSGNGRAKSCRTAQSTGYPELDNAVCKAFLATATFEVDRNPAGKFLETVARGLPGIVLISVDYAIDGTGQSSELRRNAGSFAGATPVQGWTWIKNDDYPAMAIRENQQGVVGFEVGVAAGRAIFCNVTLSSGSDILDKASCNLAMKRAIFSQARDVDGKPVLGITNHRFRWVLPVEQPQRKELVPHDSDISLAAVPAGLTNAVFPLRYLIDEKGKVVRCEADRTSGIAALDAAACKYTSGDSFTIIRDSQGKAMRSVQIRSIGITLQQ